MRRCLRAAGGVAAAALTLGLAGCATRPPADEAHPWISGRLSVRVAEYAGQAARGLDADFDLRGDSGQGELRLSSTLGTRLASTHWRAGEAVLDLGQGPVRYPDLASLSRAALGEVLPLQALPDWLAGRPWPGAQARMQADGFEQLGWQVLLGAFDQGRIDALREQPPRVSVRVRRVQPQQP
ncbi:MAG TPA: lipoprotein insertase outer membrane protein LolB [Rubrivivax sp.]|nr:outer membrane lipoprotein LolB [Burkholderiales bacterium]HNU10684.1 lipoprotein insertase outer membrane protein LolB [Rubrivivax sp.]